MGHGRQTTGAASSPAPPSGSGVVSIGKINITDTLKKGELLLRKDQSVSPQVRAMMDLLVLVTHLLHLLVGKLGLNRPVYARRFRVPAGHRY